MTKRILMYGIQRSGSNYLEELLKQRFKIKFVNNFKDRGSILHKHARLYEEKNIIPSEQYRNDIVFENYNDFKKKVPCDFDYILVVSKDPYSWLLSYRSWAKKCNWKKVSHNYLEEYNLFYKKLLEFSEDTDKIVFVKYIDLVRNKERVLEGLRKQMSLNEKFIYRLKYRSIRKVNCSSEFTKERRDFYLKRHYLKEYTGKELDQTSDIMDKDVLDKLGYESIKDK